MVRPFCIDDASVSRLLLRLVVAVRELVGGAGGAPSALDDAAADELAVELDHAAETEEGGDLVLAFEGAEHAGEVAGRGDLGAYAAAERLAARGAA
jgi:hypothetical protein